MSLGKLPGIKGLRSGSQEKRRFKNDLSVDMISPPLGDFRHTMHVGRGGDVFGDTSFLSNYGGVREPGSPDSASSSKTTGFLTRTFRHVRKNSVPRPPGGSRELSSPPPDISPIMKNAVSLPQLNMDSPNGCLKRTMFPSSISSTDDPLCRYGLQSGFVTLPRFSRFDRQFQDKDGQRSSLTERDSGFTMTRSDSLTSFTVDLGPSLMTEVLSLIDNPSGLQMSDHYRAADEEDEGGDEEEEGDDGSLTETPVQSPENTSPNPSLSSRNMNHRGRSCSPSCTEQEEEDGRSLRTPDASMGSPQRVEPVMEAERFQKAADMLSRHYGGGSFTKATRTSTASPASSCSRKTQCVFSEEEEEIKV